LVDEGSQGVDYWLEGFGEAVGALVDHHPLHCVLDASLADEHPTLRVAAQQTVEGVLVADLAHGVILSELEAHRGSPAPTAIPPPFA
jgi:hypothetical protein